MELTGQTIIPFPRAEVFAAYRDRVGAIVPFLPNVETFEPRERFERDGRINLVNWWKARVDLPQGTQKLIDPDWFAWTESASWDEARWACDWRIDVGALPGVLECAGVTRFAEGSPDSTEVTIDGQLVLRLENARVPRLLIGAVRPVVEKLIVTTLTPNLLSMGEAVGNYLASRRSMLYPA